MPDLRGPAAPGGGLCAAPAFRRHRSSHTGLRQTWSPERPLQPTVTDLSLPGTFLGHTWKQDSLFGLDSPSPSLEQWGKLDWAQAGTAAGPRWGELRGPLLSMLHEEDRQAPDWPCQPVPVLSLTYSRDLGRPGQGWPEDPQDEAGCMPPAPLGLADCSPEALHGFQGGPLGETRHPLNSPPHGAPQLGRGHLLALTAAHPGNSQAQPRGPASVQG